MCALLTTNTKTLVVLLLFALMACTSQDSTMGPKTGLGAAAGAAGGGLIGAAAGGGTEGILAGVLIGGLIGGAVGNALDQDDRRMADETASESLETQPAGTTSTWRNPDSGHSGTFTPTYTYQEADGTYCREFQQSIKVGDQVEQAYGTACRQPDGQWKVVN